MNSADPKEVIEALLERGDAMLCIDSRHRGVQVPENHRNNSALRLVLNLGFRNPINLLDDGVEAVLVFGGVRHHCWIPYDSLWGVYNPETLEGMVWPERIPEELAGAVSKSGQPEKPGKPAKQPPAAGQGQQDVSGARKKENPFSSHPGREEQGIKEGSGCVALLPYLPHM